ncbi:translesion DNA synthesis-associated protein ImuA [Paraburkholderia sp. UCT31]|uniref:translesion DNA synthesis-associated protein ImuA n=1 Tax=Paraburkholderia sp. UCT31 TaxID=2615209 RepID=UPI0016550E76|nr:translesion DNA synthesis-associated protein ImuA [Paraburkholderia sp. UCT31]MBC8740407.1 translesion DNA synthesis-associated protein ImuA [Paraburkholderia sp. UCT31]
MLAAVANPESIHPSLWRASQLARGDGRCVETGYPALSGELPGGGWPVGALVDLLVQQQGIGELRLLEPVLRASGKGPVALVQPPHLPNSLALANWGIPLERCLVMRPERTADALWAAEQILRAGTCSTLVFWQNHMRAESLRRLHLAAQSSETLFFMIRPLPAAQDASPSPLRLALRPVADGLSIDFVKRRGPLRHEPLVLSVLPSPSLLDKNAPMDWRAPGTSTPVAPLEFATHE